ncbi:MAG: glycoside hydrolase family 28 protein [Planctomycetes bacterium]|nr:glycoside hydrolase family 28 protein [Planctomycetota bacterium]
MGRPCTSLAAAGMLLSLLLPAGTIRAEEFRMPQVKEPAFPARTIHLSDFGAVGDGKTQNTAALARAIDSLAKEGGGKLVIPPGIWLTGPIHLRSNVNLHLEAGALLQFVSDYKQYPLVVLDLKGEKEVWSLSPLSGEGLENVAITGRGVIDGGGAPWRPVSRSKVTESEWNSLPASGVVDSRGETWWPSREAMEGAKLVERLRQSGSVDPREYEPAHQFLRPKLLKLIGCRRVLLEGVTFQNPPNWTLNPTLCEDLTIRGITVHNAPFEQNTDGLDLESCRNVLVRDSTFDAGDDGICLKSGKDAPGRRIGVPTENVLIENCVVYHGHGGLTIGSEMSGGVRNVQMNNCLFVGTDIGLRFKSTRGRGGVVEKIYVSNVRMTDIAAEAINFNMYYEGRSPLNEKGALVKTEESPVPVSEETPRFRDIHIQDVVCRGARSAMLLQGLPEMPLQDISLRNVSITAQRGVVCMDARNITLDHVEILNSQGPVLNLVRTRDLRIDHLVYPAGAEPVLQIQGSGIRDIVIRNTDFQVARDMIRTDGAAADAVRVQEE